MGLKTVELQMLGREVYGEGWVYRLAKARGVAVRTAQRWASGANEPPEGLLGELRSISRTIQDYDAQRSLDMLIGDLLRDTAAALKADPDGWADHTN